MSENYERGGRVLYDGDCSSCESLASRGRPALERRGFAVEPLHAGRREGCSAPAPGARDELIVLTPGGERLGGADALIHLAGRFWWGKPIRLVAALPGAMAVLRAGYRWVARRRYRVGKSSRPSLAAWAPLVLLTALAGLGLGASPAWVRMWSLTAALGLGLKWLTFCDARRAGLRPKLGRVLGYFLAWPGLDGRAFLDSRKRGDRGRPGEWLATLVFLALGAALLAGLAPAVLPGHPLAGGWLAMTGMILCLHFGVFHLLSLAWRRAGVDAPPIMRAPLLATSATEFWGARWNRAFSDVARRFVLALIARRWGAPAGTMASFLASGLVHEMVITVPARAGYGLPTAYFVLQGAMVLFERTPFARRIGLGRGWRGRLVAVASMAGPVFWLFPPPFIRNVILPMLHSMDLTT